MSGPKSTDLTRALTRRGERILAASDIASEVAALEPLEAYYIVREIGLDQALPILLELSPEQLEACVDLDCWNRYDFATDSLDEWLTAFALAGPETLARSFSSLDYVVQLLFLAQTVTVYDPDTDQVPPEDEGKDTPRATTPDGFYLLDVKTDLALKVHPFTLLDALYQYDPLAAQLLDHVGHGPRVIGTKIADVAQLAEMQLDGHELPVHVDLSKPGLPDHLLELGGQPVSESHRAEIRKINLRFLHFLSPLFPNLLIAQISRCF